MGGAVAALALVVAGVLVVATSASEDGVAPAAEGPGSAAPGGGAATQTPSDDPTPTEQPAAPAYPAYRDWLEPERELVLGDHRYVSACQALSLDDVRELYGEPRAGTVVSESFLDRSFGVDEYRTDDALTDCWYRDIVRLDAEQPVDGSNLGELGLGNVLQSYRDDEQPGKVRLYREAARADGDPELVAFVDDLARVAKARVRYSKTFQDKELRGLPDLAEVVQPIGSEAYAFRFFVDDVAYELVDEAGGDAADLRQELDSSIARRLRTAMDAIARIREHVGDPELSQSPSPTVARPSDTIGGTRILEPCAVLSRQVFRQITGLQDNQVVERLNIPLIPPGSAIEPEQGASNSCRRHHVRDRRYGDLTTDITIAIDYFGSARKAARALRKGDFDGRRLDTDADLFIVGDDGPFSDLGIVLHTALLGPYRISLDYSTLDRGGAFSDGSSAYASDRDYVRAVNAVVRSLQRNLAVAQESDGK